MPDLAFRLKHFAFYSLSATAIALLTLTASIHLQAQQPTSPAPPQVQQKDNTQLATAQEDAEVEALTKELSAVAEEPIIIAAHNATNDAGPAGIVPIQKGFNASLGSTSQHDSSDGWSSVLNPNVAFRFSHNWSVNVGLPVYAHILVSTEHQPSPAKPGGALPPEDYILKARSFLLGDTAMAADFELHSPHLDYNITGTLGAPTGDYIDGLGAGQFTYSINNHFEHSFADWLNPEIELGIGDSSSLLNSRVRDSYIVVGENAHFQAGFAFYLPFNINFTTDAYEELPVSTQTVTSTTSNGKKGKQQKIITTTSQESVGEDNGFINTLDIPLNGHVTLSGFYNRSLRNKVDTAGFSLTFILRSTPHGKSDVH